MGKGTKKLRPFDLPKLFTKTEFLYDRTVAFDILLLEVVEKVSSLTNHFVHTTAAVVVVVVVLQVLGEVVDSGGENRDLYFGRTGVFLVGLVSGDDSLLCVFLQHDIHLIKILINLLCYRWTQQAAGEVLMNSLTRVP